MHNYHDTYGMFAKPAMLGLTVSSGLEPTTVTTWAVSLLPMLDQGPLFERYSKAASPFNPYDPNNYPITEQVIPGFLCPSTPGGNEVVEYRIPAGKQLLDPPAPPTGADFVFRGGRTDYEAVSGVRGDLANLAYAQLGMNAGGPRHSYATWNLCVVAPPAFVGMADGGTGGRVRDITDGTSNTLMVVELAARNQLWRVGRMVTDDTDPEFKPQKLSGGGGWADPFKELWIEGRLYDGTPGANGGPCGINCSNFRGAGLYSFHAGGAFGLFCDGSVKFINQSLSQAVLAAIITAAKGETVQF